MWYKCNSLEITLQKNTLQPTADKAEELLVDFCGRSKPLTPVTDWRADVEVVQSTKYLGRRMTTNRPARPTLKKGQRRLLLLRRLL